MMNDLTTVIMPPIPIDFESGQVPKEADPKETSADDFASMLASVWCGPASIQLQDFILPKVNPEKVDLEPVTTPLVGGPVVENTELGQAANISLPAQKAVPEVEVETLDVLPTPAPPLSIESETVVQTPSENSISVSREFVRDPNPGPIPAVKMNFPVPRTPTLTISQPVPDPLMGGTEFPVLETDIETEGLVSPQTTKGATPEATLQPPAQLTTEAIKREANLVATYLAQSARDSRESIESIKAQISGNGPDSDTRDSKSENVPQSKTPNAEIQTNVALASLSFASALKKQSADAVKETIAPQVANQLVEMAGVTSSKQSRMVRLRLRPEELGGVDIQLSRDAAGKVSAHMVVERDTARTVLSQSLPQLRETLERAGLNVDKLNVSSDVVSTGGNSREPNQQSNGESRHSTFIPTESSSTEETRPKERHREHKLLSLSA